MIVRFFIILLLIPTFTYASSSGNGEENPTHAIHPKKMNWEFEGFFGRFDKASIQRGFQVYKEVCSNCHSLKRAAYRNLEDIGLRQKYKLNLVTLLRKQEGSTSEGTKDYHIIGVPDSKTVIEKTDIIVLFGLTKNIERFLEINK